MCEGNKTLIYRRSRPLACSTRAQSDVLKIRLLKTLREKPALLGSDSGWVMTYEVMLVHVSIVRQLMEKVFVMRLSSQRETIGGFSIYGFLQPTLR
jgi:hypothetical protein